MFLYLRLAARLLVIGLCMPLLLGCEDNTIEPDRNGVLTGVVVDSNDNQPLANVAITTNPATSSYTTDAQGRFSIEVLPIGKYALSIKKADYKQETVNVQVNLNATTDVKILLEKAAGSNRRPNAPASPEPADKASGPAHYSHAEMAGERPRRQK